MKMTGYSEPQILAILRQAEGGVPMAELCREHELSNASFYKWRAKYGGTDASMVSQMKAMEEENWRLKRMYADLKAFRLELESRGIERTRYRGTGVAIGGNGLLMRRFGC